MTRIGANLRRTLAPVALLCAAAARADCTPEPADAIFDEQNRIRDCLENVARYPVQTPAAGPYVEDRLYTWGPEVKIDRMLASAHFCAYEYARQREYELRRHAASWSSAIEPWYRVDDVTGMPDLAARQATRTDNQQLSLLFLFEGMTPAGVTLEQRRAQVAEALNALRENPEYEPGYSPANAVLEGRAAAHDMPLDARPSSIKTGRGVYFATDPFTFFSTGEGRNHGLVCDVPPRAAIVDLTDDTVVGTLARQRIWYREPVDLIGAEIVPFIGNPRLFDAAARGRFIVRARFPHASTPDRQVWVDKCAIDYRRCRRVSMAPQDLRCSDFKRLLGVTLDTRGRWVVDTERPALPPALLAAFASDPASAQTMRRRVQDCFGSSDFTGLARALRRKEAARAALADLLE